jgi:Sensors of blue-light using FAD
MTGFLRIVYCSRNCIAGSRADIEVQIRNILATARTNNREIRVTGAMTFNESCFAQVLKGQSDDLLPLFERIRRDPRHCDVKILEKSQPKSRLFPQWSMAYVDTPLGDGRHPLAHFSFEAALTKGAAPEANALLDALQRLTRAMA